VFQHNSPESVSAELQARREQIRGAFARRYRTRGTVSGATVAIPRQRSHPPTAVSGRSRVRAV
jgi:hypothetical protein